ncbi:MAG: cell division protein FtsN [Granulosicoccus sp.]|jgi:cell division protein FtsN
MNTTPGAAPGSRFFVLALGLLVGFVIGFVMLLSRLPMDSTLNDFVLGDIRPELLTGDNYQFYSLLEDQTVARNEIVLPAVSPRLPSIPPATRVVPGSVQSISPRNLAAESYAEIPASSLGQESYYLQAGNYPRSSEAEQTRAALLLLGLDAFIVVRKDSDGSTGHRVRIGPFFDQDKVTNAKKRLQKGGINYKLIRVTG